MEEILQKFEDLLEEVANVYEVDSKDFEKISEEIFLQERSEHQDLFVVNQNSGILIQAYNLKINFKKILDAFLDMTFSGTFSNRSTNAILMIIGLGYKLLKASIIRFDKIYAEIIVFLHNMNAYRWPIKEEEVIEFITSRNKNLNPIQIIGELNLVKVIDIVEGKIILQEQVVIRACS